MFMTILCFVWYLRARDPVDLGSTIIGAKVSMATWILISGIPKDSQKILNNS